jgi:hypothetical protein
VVQDSQCEPEKGDQVHLRLLPTPSAFAGTGASPLARNDPDVLARNDPPVLIV